jgi:hypothetical protein
MRSPTSKGACRRASGPGLATPPAGAAGITNWLQYWPNGVALSSPLTGGAHDLWLVEARHSTARLATKADTDARRTAHQKCTGTEGATGTGSAARRGRDLGPWSGMCVF